LCLCKPTCHEVTQNINFRIKITFPNTIFKVFTAVKIQVVVFWVMTPRSVAVGYRYQCFGGLCCLHLHDVRFHNHKQCTLNPSRGLDALFRFHSGTRFCSYRDVLLISFQLLDRRRGLGIFLFSTAFRPTLGVNPASYPMRTGALFRRIK